jgi:hypothetical protein
METIWRDPALLNPARFADEPGFALELRSTG